MSDKAMHILIADDELLVRERVKQIIPFEEMGISHVSEAEDGEIALEILKKERPQIAILDIDMPFVNGLQLLQTIREQHLETQAIILSGYTDFSFAQEAIKQNVIAYLTKPVKREEMLAALNKASVNLRKEEAQRVHELQAGLQILLHQGSVTDAIKATIPLSEHEWIHLAVIDGAPSEQHQITNTLKTNLHSRGYRVYMTDGIIPWNTLCVISETKHLPDFASILTGHNLSVCTVWLDGPVKRLEELSTMYLRIRYARQIRLFYAPPGIRTIKIHETHTDMDVMRKTWKTVFSQGSSLTVSNLLKEQIGRFRDYDSGEPFVQYLSTLLGIATQYAQEEKHPLPKNVLLPIPVISLMEQFADLNGLLSWLESLFENLLKDENKKTDVATLSDRVLSVIETDYTNKNLNLQAIADAVNAHPNYVSTRFKEETGKNVMTHLKEVRLTAAKSMIEDGGMSCCDAAWLVGFSDQYYFSKCFKKVYGISPGALSPNQ